MSENTIHEAETKETHEAVEASEAIKPAVPLLVIRHSADAGEKKSSEQHTNVVDLEQFKASQGKVISEETLVQEWQLNSSGKEPPVKLIMVSSGFGSQRSYISRNTDIQCKAA